MNKDHLDILRERLVLGEITLEQYHELVEAITTEVSTQHEKVLINKWDGTQTIVSTPEAKRLIQKGDLCGDEKAKYVGTENWIGLSELIDIHLHAPNGGKDSSKTKDINTGIEKGETGDKVINLQMRDTIDKTYSSKADHSDAHNYFDKIIKFLKLKFDRWILLNAFAAGVILGSHAAANTPDMRLTEKLLGSLFAGAFFTVIGFLFCLITKNPRTLVQEKLKSSVKHGYWLLLVIVIGNFLFLLYTISGNDTTSVIGYNLNYYDWFSSLAVALACFLAVHYKKYSFFIWVIVARHCTDFLFPGLFPISSPIFLVVNWYLWLSAINAYKLEKYFPDESIDSVDY